MRKASNEVSNDFHSTHTSVFAGHSFTNFTQYVNHRDIVIERCWDEGFLRDEVNFKYLERLKSWGWWSVINDINTLLPNAVKSFYLFPDNNCYVNGDVNGSFASKIVTRILNTNIAVDGNKLNRLLGVKNVSGEKEIPRNFNQLEASMRIIDDNTLGEILVNTNRFDVHTRILHLMVAQSLNLRGGRHAHVNCDELYWMSRITDGNPPNLGEYIVKKMMKSIRYIAAEHNKYGLAYGKVMTRLIRSKVRVIPPRELTTYSKKF